MLRGRLLWRDSATIITDFLACFADTPIDQTYSDQLVCSSGMSNWPDGNWSRNLDLRSVHSLFRCFAINRNVYRYFDHKWANDNRKHLINSYNFIT